jgi:hypothetical protein
MSCLLRHRLLVFMVQHAIRAIDAGAAQPAAATFTR